MKGLPFFLDLGALRVVHAAWVPGEIAFPNVPGLPEERADLRVLAPLLGYGPAEPPVFFGHYKLTHRPVAPQAANVATLDYGLGHGGAATAYRWSGESSVLAENYVQLPV